MKLDSRGRVVASILSGVLASLATCVALMAVMAFAIVRLDISDGFITGANQVIKIVSVFAGCWFCVGRGGEKGFALGAATGLIFMALGYAAYCLLGGKSPGNILLACEFTLGALIGALSGALVANLPPRRRMSGKTAKLRKTGVSGA